MGQCVSGVSIKSQEGCVMNKFYSYDDEPEDDIEDRISLVHRFALCVALAPIALVILFAYGLAWVMTPDCECDE